MNCQSCRIEIEELEISESLSKAASAHLNACSSCGAFYHERLSLRRLVGSLEPVTAPSDFEFRLRARIAASESVGNHRFSFRSFIASAPAISLAASFALLIAAFVVYNHFKSGPAVNNQTNEVARQESMQKTEQPNSNAPSGNIASKDTTTVSTPDDKDSSPPVLLPAGDNPHRRVGVISRNAVHRQPRELDAGSQQIESRDEAVRPAPRIMPQDSSPFTAKSGPLVELPVRSSSQAMRVFVGDKSGGKRSVTFEPVIFGSQDLTGRNNSRVQTSQGIW
ncbi:MAG TPA: hypothetical protein VGN95_08030 [Pyrinomonadaceae bacterium]|jgi:hypothetical protein|nr:hypothetical protein [Pyrinomonadaceae bacterium]